MTYNVDPRPYDAEPETWWNSYVRETAARLGLRTQTQSTGEVVIPIGPRARGEKNTLNHVWAAGPGDEPGPMIWAIYVGDYRSPKTLLTRLLGTNRCWKRWCLEDELEVRCVEEGLLEVLEAGGPPTAPRYRVRISEEERTRRRERGRKLQKAVKEGRSRSDFPLNDSGVHP